MHAVRIVLLALCCAIGGAAHALPNASLMREADFRAGGTLLPADHAVEESRRAIVALRAYAASGDDTLYRDALRRALHLAAFNPRASSLEDSLTVAWALALASDWLAPRLEAADQARLLAALRLRAGVLFNKAWPESVPALLVIARTLADHDHQAKLLSLQLEREK